MSSSTAMIDASSAASNGSLWREIVRLGMYSKLFTRTLANKGHLSVGLMPEAKIRCMPYVFLCRLFLLFTWRTETKWYTSCFSFVERTDDLGATDGRAIVELLARTLSVDMALPL